MRRAIHIFFLLAVITMMACEEEEKGPVIKEMSPQEITKPQDGSFTIITEALLDSMFVIEWSPATYDVNIPEPTYVIQLDLENNNFEDPVNLASTNTLTTSVTYQRMNQIMTQDFGVEDSVETSMKIKITSGFDDLLVQESQVVSFSMIPYFEPEVIDTTEPPDTTVPPEPDTLYLVGSATIVGWDNTAGLPIINDGTSDIYTITTDFIAGGMKILKYLGEWAPQWGTDETGTGESGPLIYRPDEITTDPPEIPSPGTGTFKLDVNIEELTYSFSPA